MDIRHAHDRPLLAAGMGDLTDSDVLVEVTLGREWQSGRGGEITAPVKDALAASYKALASPVETEVETVAILEEMPMRRVTTWLRAHARRESDGAGAPPGSLLKFLARGTLTVLQWMEGSSKPKLAHVQQALAVLAAGTSPVGVKQPSAPGSADLVRALAAWQRARACFREDDCVRILMQHGSTRLDLTKKLADPETLLVEKKLVSPPVDMIFVVEAPDYRRTGEWQLKHGEAHVVGTCEGGALDRFYRRELDIRPRDALHCRVEFETSYGPDHEVLAERFRIVEVLEVLPACTPFVEEKAPEAEQREQRRREEELVEQFEGDFGVLTLRRLPIH